jgi:RNA polymerase sigma factor (sigma-70 family)
LPDDGDSANPDFAQTNTCDSWAVRVSTGVARGEREALAEFYRAWFDRALAAARKATGRDESFCLDVVQDAMVKAAAKLRPVRSAAELGAWMQRVVHSCALDRLRQEAARARRERTPAPAATDGPPDVEERIAWLAAELADRPPADGDLLRHRLLNGATLEQAARSAGISGPAAHGRLRRLVDALRRAGKARFGDA